METNDRQKTFLILDGNAMIHRAYHAMPPFTTKDGTPTGAVYGFFSMILKLIADIKPSYIAVTFDKPKPTFRKTLFTGYQAKRPKMEDALASQMVIVHELLDESCISIFEVDGFEADDVIGTLAAKAARINTNTTNKYQYQISNDKKEIKENIGLFEIGNLKLEIIIVTGDRDLLQLVNNTTFVLMPVAGITKMKLFGEKEVVEKYELSPKQIIDYKALAGDASDNYPGVRGIGPKTAIELLKKYKNVEELYKRILEVESEDQKLALKLTEGQEPAILAKQLATVICDVPLNFTIENCDFKHLDGIKLAEAFDKYEIRSLVKRINEIFPDTPAGAPAKKNNKTGKNVEQLDLLS